MSLLPLVTADGRTGIGRRNVLISLWSEIQKYGDADIQKDRDVKIQKYRNTEIQKYSILQLLPLLTTKLEH